ncbi:MAG: Glu-tRNA(Gln) amidotransferase GatDE subunit E [Thermoplasmata archaeon]|nr:MAG: Glu-tRNA(Gln) amidotransferase GatDE subunit E [Thermoplasmata archaeon]
MDLDDDYFRSLDLKVGFEIHQQLKSKRKLFCRCPPVLRSDEPDFVILRHMRPTLSEMGTYDGTALMEFKTKKEIYYQIYKDTTCTYEIDDTPPFEMDEEAIVSAMAISLALGCNLVDEVHVSRKQYLDGSIPTGFQRTAIIGVGGKVPLGEKEVGIRLLTLEEDACREIEDRRHRIVFRIDRLSIPLVEVITEPDARTPREAQEIAGFLGRILRYTGLVRRGEGSVRQDVNVSIRGGRRVEIKGVPRLNWIATLVAGEAIRQKNLLEIKEELLSRGVRREEWDTESFATMRHEEVTHLFAGREVPLFKDAFPEEVVEGGENEVRAVLLPGFAGVLSRVTHGSRTFADELSGRVKVIACLDWEKNILTSEEEPFGGVTKEDMARVGELLGAGERDSFVLVWGPREDTRTAVEEIYIRAAEALEGVPNETRQVLSPHETTFERILPGPDRMYPDTDMPPIEITEDMLRRAREHVPEPPLWEVERELEKMGLDREKIRELVVSPLFKLFKMLIEAGIRPPLALYFSYDLPRALRRRGIDMSVLVPEELCKLAKMVQEERLPLKAAPRVIASLKEGRSLQETLESLGWREVTVEDLKETLRKLMEENPALLKDVERGRYGPLMEMLDKLFGGMVHGGRVLRALGKL